MPGKFLSTLFALTLTLFGSITIAQAEGFPGKGDEDAWSDALPYYNRGNRYLAKEQYEQALEDFKVAVGKYTFDPDFYLNLGVAYRKVGDYANAETAYKKSLALNDKDWMPWNDLANVYLKQDKLKETVATFQRALKCNPPAKDKAAIQQDIIDINKILRMQAPPPKAAAKPTDEKTAPTNGGTSQKSAAKSASVNGAARSASVNGGTNAKTAAKLNEAPAQTPTKSQLKSGGWDYVYDK
ncbi:MAG TPA: tetratricopeptide repeat protein [Drouetiella sp.]